VGRGKKGKKEEARLDSKNEREIRMEEEERKKERKKKRGNRRVG
jgi:hypothetical protein